MPPRTLAFARCSALALTLLLPLAGCRTAGPGADQSSPPLMPLSSIDPTIVQDIRYAGSDNFVGQPIDGYEAPLCLLTPAAARRLAEAQAEVRPFGLSLKVFDCYRPQRAVDHFVRWSRDTADVQTKQRFFPEVEKNRLFDEGYIAERSGHSRGSTVDLTLVRTPDDSTAALQPVRTTDCRIVLADSRPGAELDMGTTFDCFDPLSHTANPAVSPEARHNRLLLKVLLERHGFVNYSREWWHFRLRDEPFPETYFNVPVR